MRAHGGPAQLRHLLLGTLGTSLHPSRPWALDPQDRNHARVQSRAQCFSKNLRCRSVSATWELRSMPCIYL